jgi:hypothetical protein
MHFWALGMIMMIWGIVFDLLTARHEGWMAFVYHSKTEYMTCAQLCDLKLSPEIASEVARADLITLQ